VHIKSNVDGAGICLDDAHGYIGQGEIAIEAIEVNAIVQVRVERSTGWLIDWPIIETKDEIMVFSSYTAQFDERPVLKYVDIVREAYRAMCDVVAAKVGCTPLEANTLVAAAVDIRNCALYGFGEGLIPKINRQEPWDIAVVAVLPKDVFLL
jgi:acetamidase/formamidase